MTPEKLAAVLGVFAVAFNRELTPETVEVYALALDDLTDADLDRAAAGVLRGERFFPPPAVVLQYARRGGPDPAAVAGHVFQQALALTERAPDGIWWSGARIRSALGEAAYQAFFAAGGSSGFRLADDPFHGPAVRKAFMECYQRVLRDDATLALPAPDHTPDAIKRLAAGVGRPLPGRRP